jgi:hypothetical protein
MPVLLNHRDCISVGVHQTLSDSALEDKVHVLSELLGRDVRKQPYEDEASGHDDEERQKHEKYTLDNVFTHIYPHLLFCSDNQIPRPGHPAIITKQLHRHCAGEAFA